MHQKASILEERPINMPIAGHVRTGIKVLKSEAAKNERARAIYEAGLAQGLDYDSIADKIEKECKIRTALVPRNIPYFRVSPRDFQGAPEIPRRLLDLYGEDRGDGLGTQLYRFPVVFPFDQWLQNLPHKLAAFGRSGIRFWSEYDAAGDRYCLTLGAADIDPKNQRAKRVWGGRPREVRQDNGGHCDPANCPQYQAKECTLHGRLLFYVPKIPGSSLLALDTTSVYSMQQMRAQMALVAGLRAGKLSGTFGSEPIFYVTKKLEEIVRLDERGEPKKVKQYLVYLESNIQMVEVMAAAERRSNAIAHYEVPVPAAPEDDEEGHVSQAEALEHAPLGHASPESTPPGQESPPQAARAPADPAPSPASAGGAPGPADAPKKSFPPEVAALRREVFALAQAKKRDPARLDAELRVTLGAGWGEKVDTLKSAKFILENE